MTITIALVIAGAVAAVSPLVLRYVHLDGLQMAAVSYGVALLISASAALLTGELHLDRASVVTVLAGSTAFWTVQQAVFKVLAERAPGMVTEKPTIA